MTIYFDIDGGLALVREEDTRPQRWRDPGYFRRLPADMTAVRIARFLSLIQGNTVNVLTRIFDEPASNDIWTADKKFWCQQNVDFIDTETAFTCTNAPDKAHILNCVPAHLKKYHVLIDDEPHNLETWSKNGGTAVQYLQPERTIPEWPGFKLYAKHGVIRCTASLATYLKSIENGELT